VFLNYPLPTDPVRESAFARANEEYYASVDWAVDISNAEFVEADLRSLPARLVKRDPETQVVVRRERVLATREIWERLDLSATPWDVALENMILFNWSDRVLVAPKANRRDFERHLNGLRALRRAGVAELD
jgi:hypothetical protein